MSGFSLKNGVIKFDKDAIYDENTRVEWIINTTPIEASYGNIQYKATLKVNNMQIKSIEGAGARVRGSASQLGTSISFCGNENTAFIRLHMEICRVLEETTKALVDLGKLPRQYYSPYRLDGPVYDAKNKRHRAKAAKDGKPVEDAKIFYGMSGTVYMISGSKLIKTKINRKYEGRLTTILIDDDDSHILDFKTVLKYADLANDLSKSKNSSDKFSASFAQTWYGTDRWKNLINCARRIDDKEPGFEKAKVEIAKFGKIVESTELETVLTNRAADRFVVKVLPTISDSSKNEHSLTFKLVADAVTVTESIDPTDATMDEYDREYEAQIAAEYAKSNPKKKSEDSEDGSEEEIQAPPMI